MKEILISIKPNNICNIANHLKFIELRKTKPTTKVPFKCFIYCTNDRKYVLDFDNKFFIDKNYGGKHYYNGKVVGEFICNKVENYITKRNGDYFWTFNSQKEIEDFKVKTCLSIEELISYTGDSNGLYGWHISDLKIYDKPKELSEFQPLKRPPQSWCYVEF